MGYWKNLNYLVSLCTEILSENPLFFLINSYTTGLSSTVLKNILTLTVDKHKKGKITCGEIGLKGTQDNLVLPCGIYGRWEKTMKINVLYEDNHVLVVEKPMNMLSQGDSTKDEDLLTLVKEYIKEKYHKPGNVYAGLVHRLDRPVGGIMVFAKTSKAASRLSQEIVDHKIKKYYLAIVNGIIKEKEEHIMTK